MLKKIILTIPIFVSTTLLCMDENFVICAKPSQSTQWVWKNWSECSPAELLNVDEKMEGPDGAWVPRYVKPLNKGYIFKLWSELSPAAILNADETMEGPDGVMVPVTMLTPPESLNRHSERDRVQLQNKTFIRRLLRCDSIVSLTIISLIASSILCQTLGSR